MHNSSVKTRRTVIGARRGQLNVTRPSTVHEQLQTTTTSQESTLKPAYLHLFTLQAHTITAMFKRKHSIEPLTDHRKQRTIPVGLSSPEIQLPGKSTTARESWPTGLAFRISNIPSCITQDQFLQIVGRLGLDVPLGVGLPAPAYSNLLAWSFAPSAASADAEQYRTATVTFKSVPAEFQYAGTSTSADFVPNAPAAVIDKQFYGLTPLYCGERPMIE